jgi:hypothetical protein
MTEGERFAGVAVGGDHGGGFGAQRDGPGFAAGDLVGQDELGKGGVGHVVLAGQSEALGQGGGEVGAERVGQR